MILVLFAMCVAQTPPDLVFMVAGQSNAAGHGLVSDLPAGFPRNADRILMFDNAWVFRAGTEPLDDSTGQVDGASKDTTYGVGPGVAFAERLTDLVPNRIILVPCAKGGSSSSQWLPDATLQRSTMFSSCLWRALYAARHGALAGVIWYQGEQDASMTGTPGYVAGYASRTQTIFDAYRLHSNIADLPVVYAQLHPTQPGPAYTSWETIRTAQAGLEVPRTMMVQALGTKVDTMHLSTASQLDLGRRMAERYALEILDISL